MLEESEPFIDLGHPAHVTWDTLGQPSGKFDFYVKISPPASVQVPLHSITPQGWGPLFHFQDLVGVLSHKKPRHLDRE